MNLIFVGNKFYQESGSMMSSIYQVVGDKLYRQDWGKVQIALSEGQEVHIRPANEIEMAWAEKKLAECKSA